MSSVVDYGSKTDKYTWDQNKDEVTLVVPLHEQVRGRDVVCNIKKESLQVGVKGKPFIIDGELGGTVKVSDATWYVSDGHTVELTLPKLKKGNWWKSAIKGEAEIDTDLIEGSQYLDDSLLRKVKEQKQKKEEEAASAHTENKESQSATDAVDTNTTPAAGGEKQPAH
ncbi:Nuclear migration protein nudC [Balamuthia mandrillaris]